METSSPEMTEDVYQTLHQPPVSKNTKPKDASERSSKLMMRMMIMMIFNTLLLITVLILVGLFHWPVAEENKGVWLLHDDSFYFIWEAKGNCTKAEEYCSAKASNIRLAVLTPTLRDWLFTQAKGRRLLVAQDKNVSECTLVGDPKLLETSFISGEEQGWVCEHLHKKILGPPGPPGPPGPQGLPGFPGNPGPIG